MFTKLHGAILALLMATGCASRVPTPDAPTNESTEGALGWRVVESTRCGFRVKMPASPTETVSHEDSESVPMTTWELVAETRGGSGAAAASCSKRDDGEDLQAAKEHLDEIVSEVLDGMKAKLVDKRTVTVRGHAGREARFTSPEGDGVLRILVGGKSVYTLVTIGLGAAATKTFFDSFAFTSDARRAEGAASTAKE